MQNKNMRKTLIGKVVTNKMQNGAVVAVERSVTHPLYGKKLRRTTRFTVDTNNTKVEIGDIVRIEETKKMSKNKYFKIIGKGDSK